MAYAKQLHEFRKIGKYTDMTIFTDDVKVDIHKCVAKAIFPYISGYLNWNPSNSREVDMSEAFAHDPEIMTAIIEYVYTGKIAKCPDIVNMLSSPKGPVLLEVANYLSLDAFLKECDDNVQAYLTPQNFISYMHIASVIPFLSNMKSRTLDIAMANTRIDKLSLKMPQESAESYSLLMALPDEDNPQLYTLLHPRSMEIYKMNLPPINHDKCAQYKILAAGIGDTEQQILVQKRLPVSDVEQLYLYNIKTNQYTEIPRPLVCKTIPSANSVQTQYTVGDSHRQLITLCLERNDENSEMTGSYPVSIKCGCLTNSGEDGWTWNYRYIEESVIMDIDELCLAQYLVTHNQKTHFFVIITNFRVIVCTLKDSLEFISQVEHRTQADEFLGSDFTYLTDDDGQLIVRLTDDNWLLFNPGTKLFTFFNWKTTSKHLLRSGPPNGGILYVCDPSNCSTGPHLRRKASFISTGKPDDSLMYIGHPYSRFQRMTDLAVTANFMYNLSVTEALDQKSPRVLERLNISIYVPQYIEKARACNTLSL